MNALGLSGERINLPALVELLLEEANDLALLAVDERDPMRRERLCLASGRLQGAVVMLELAL